MIPYRREGKTNTPNREPYDEKAVKAICAQHDNDPERIEEIVCEVRQTLGPYLMGWSVAMLMWGGVPTLIGIILLLLGRKPQPPELVGDLDADPG